MKHYEKYYSLLNHNRQIPQTDTTSLVKGYEDRAIKFMIDKLEEIDGKDEDV